jgi:hypothetical protein
MGTFPQLEACDKMTYIWPSLPSHKMFLNYANLRTVLVSVPDISHNEQVRETSCPKALVLTKLTRKKETHFT